ncbi:hypothetical protein [Variovorax sp. CCNWLW235]|uniref:hypothetical protein n=1 Tax=Variovorax sp. CCNWLW235 TaxID=3127463 RepID=UPI003076CF04
MNRQLLFAKAITKSPYKYNKKVFKLHHSADLHTKQPRKMPGVLWFIVIAIGLLIWKLPDAYRGVTGQAAIAATSSSSTTASGKSAGAACTWCAGDRRFDCVDPARQFPAKVRAGLRRIAPSQIHADRHRRVVQCQWLQMRDAPGHQRWTDRSGMPRLVGQQAVRSLQGAPDGSGTLALSRP